MAGAGPIMMEGQPPAWTSYISVTDADATIAKVKAAGGMVFVEPMDVLDVGRMAVFADPTGAAAAVWQPRRHIGAGLVNEPGALAWNELATRDVPAATAFYAEVFGWEAETADMGGMEYTTWKLGGNQIGGMMAMPAEVPAEVPSTGWPTSAPRTATPPWPPPPPAGPPSWSDRWTSRPAASPYWPIPSGAMFGVIALAAT